jgi:sugar lactone lactonase YvrE
VRARAAIAVVAVGLSGCLWGGPDECAAYGYGTLSLSFVGLPAGGEGAAVHLTGVAVQTFVDAGVQSAASGTLYVSADLVTLADPLVRTAYAPVVPIEALCLTPGKGVGLTVPWRPIPSSNRAWFVNASGGNGDLLGFGAASLTATGTASALAAVRGGAGGEVAFDRQGNLWSLGSAPGGPALVRYAAAQLATGGPRTPDRGLGIDAVTCQPAFAGLAFDRLGNLYVSSPCAGKVLKFAAAALEANAGVLSPLLTLSDLVAPAGLAFDGQGNLLVADPAALEVVQYPASALARSAAQASARARALASDDPLDPALLTPTWLALDAGGAVWAVDVGHGLLFTLVNGLTSFGGTSVVAPGVRVRLPTALRPAGLAFDDSGGLWMAGAPGTLARLAPDQLRTSSAVGVPAVPERVITSPDVGLAGNVAFYPAPKGLPLYHALP